MPVPPDQAIETALQVETRALLKSDPDGVTINKVRERVENKLDLPESFFKVTSEWKDRSKTLIHQAIQNAESDDDNVKKEAGLEAKPAKKNGVKRQSSEEPEQKPKRAKREAPPRKVTSKAAVKRAGAKKKKSSSESELSDVEVSEEEKPKKRVRKPAQKRKAKQESESELSDLGSPDEEAKPKKLKKTLARGRPKTAVQSDEDEAKNESDAPPTDHKRKTSIAKPKHESKRAKIETDSEDDLGDKSQLAISSDPKTKASSSPAMKSKAKTKHSDDDEKPDLTAIKEAKPIVDDDSSELSSVKDEPSLTKKLKEDTKPEVDDDSSDLSSVIDEPPPRKRKSKEPKGSAKVKAAKPVAKEATGDEAEIRKLQGQLVKCGVRKIWGIELKDCGDDSRAKIRHLRKMLSDLGVTGRFSEAKAREIKERRELMADLEAVQSMNDMWGAEGRGGRASRSKAKPPVKEASDEESEVEEKQPRISKRQADLAFLGSESESE